MSGQPVAEIKALWTYGKLDSGNLVVRKYKGSDPDVFVPETIGKATVTKLNDDVFKGKDFIRSIHLPDSINIIGENLEWIKRRRKKLYPAAFENPVLLGLILDNKLIPRKELDDVISQATELGHTAVVAQLLSYSQQK